MPALDGSTPEIVARFAAVLKQEEVREELERLFRFQWPGEPAGEMNLRVLKAHKRRCTFETSFGSEDPARGIIAKVYQRDRADVFAAMESLVAAGFDGTSEFAIPLPLAYLATPHVLVQEKVSGIQAMEIFNGDEAEKQLSAARRCGSWLGHFHMKGPQEGQLTNPGELLVSIRYWAGALQKAGEPLASKTELLVRKLEAAAPGAAVGFEPRAGHGSYMPEHVMLSGNRMVGIDLDEYDLADPARDLAWFIVSLERLGLKKRGSLRIHDRAIEEFLRTYVASGPRNALSHLSFYKAAECLHRAHRDLHGRVPPIPEWSAIMLDEGIDALRWVRSNGDHPSPSPPPQEFNQRTRASPLRYEDR